MTWCLRYLCLAAVLSGCAEDVGLNSQNEDTAPAIRLELISESHSGIDFNNTLSDEGNLNVFVWNFLYTGAGVATGDVNDDGLPDIYFGGNQVPDRLYLNKGNFKFEDVSGIAGIQDNSWTTGVTMADVNADGKLDIYVCKNSPTLNRNSNRNKLFINLGEGRFSEQAAAFGIADEGFSIQATFFDADQDGDLDMYLVNQPPDQLARLIHPPEDVLAYPVTDRFYRNDNGHFSDVTAEMQMEEERYGLGISLGDFDGNGWTDLYVCNDYTHADMLYMNREGNFSDELRERTGHISYYSMGSDAGDINQDGWEDLFILDMAFEDHYRAKTNMESMQPELFWSLVREGQHFPYAQNTLQLNRGDGYFSEVGQLAGLSKSDWSWATLFADLDQDGLQDVIVTNGILRDMKNNDFTQWVKQAYQGRVGPANYRDVLAHLPSSPVPNKIYRNRGNLRFEDITKNSDFLKPGFSHGLAYADFDGDGSLDLVTNNMNAPATLFRNVSPKRGNRLTIRLTGFGSNLNALGTPVQVWLDGKCTAGTMQTTRGYYSASVPELHFGLGNATLVDSICIYWNARAMTVLRQIEANQTVHVVFSDEKKIPFKPRRSPTVKLEQAQPLPFTHKERIYDDYAEQILLPYKLSQNGPFISSGDVDGDGLEDIYVGGAAGQPGAIMLHQPDGSFRVSPQPAFEIDSAFEDQESVLFDLDGDGDLDLYVVSGSNELPEDSDALLDRMYINNGEGLFRRNEQVLPDALRINGQCVSAADFDGDGDMDLFIGGRLISGRYILPARSALLFNENGVLRDRSERISGGTSLGMVTDAEVVDIDTDGDFDLVVVGEWMAPTILLNEGNVFSLQVLHDPGSGLWWTIGSGDLDGDGDADLVVGNLGWNQKFGGASPKLSVYAADFDDNGDHDVVLAKSVGDHELPYRGRECSSEEMPFIGSKFPSYDAFANAQLKDILGADRLNQSVHSKVSTLSSVWLRNDGGLKFASQELPVAVQTGAVKTFWIADLDNDGHMDLIYAGNHFPAEVETARYDGLLHGICFGDGRGGFLQGVLSSGDVPLNGDYRDMCVLGTSKGNQLILAQNDGPLVSYVMSDPLR